MVTNVGNAYEPRDGHFHFVAPISGLYSFSLTGMAYRTTAMSLIIMKNNVNIVQIYATADDADSSSAMVHTHLNLGDHVWVENAGGPGIHLHPGTFNYFSGILEKAD